MVDYPHMDNEAWSRRQGIRYELSRAMPVLKNALAALHAVGRSKVDRSSGAAAFSGGNDYPGGARDPVEVMARR